MNEGTVKTAQKEYYNVFINDNVFLTLSSNPEEGYMIPTCNSLQYVGLHKSGKANCSAQVDLFDRWLRKDLDNEVITTEDATLIFSRRTKSTENGSPAVDEQGNPILYVNVAKKTAVRAYIDLPA